MRGFSMKSTVLLVGMTLTCSALLAQQATPQASDAATTATANQSTTSAAAPRLTAEQKKQLGEMRATARDQAAIIRNDQTLTAEQKQAKLKELHASTRAQMKSVLTPEQQQAFAARKSKAGFAAKLGLTPEQQGKLKELFQSTHQQRQSVLKDSSLTNEQKQTQLSQIRLTSKTQLATILTPEQLAQFQQMQMRKLHRHAKQG